MTNKRIFMFVGTTAELIKLAPVIKELIKRKKPFKIITSGQNNVNFEEFSGFIGTVKAYYSFSQRPIKVPLSPVISFILWTIKAFYNYLLFFSHELKKANKENTYFIVHGDTVTSLLGALIARWFGVTLVHIESGLRSFNFLEPFPEEICRYIVSRMADIHFCPNDWCAGNLKSIGGEKINTGQNTLIESFRFASKQKSLHPFVKKVLGRKKRYCVFVMHRQEHVIFKMKESGKILLSALRMIPEGMTCVFLVHDLSVNFIDSLGDEMRRSVAAPIIKTRRLPYVDFMQLLKEAEFVVTDGGSNQEETYYTGKPCLLLRSNTERIEGLERNVMLSRSNKRNIKKFIKNYKDYIQEPVHISTPPSKIIVDYLIYGK